MAGRKILLVEGTDDEHVLKHICGNRNIPDLDGVVPHKNDIDLLDDFTVRIKTSTEEGDVLGVVIDADKEPSGRWQSIRNRLLEAGYENVPDKADSIGTIVEPPDRSILPRVGVWIMPDNVSQGKLENFLRHLVPEDDDLIARATDVVDNLRDRRFRCIDKIKAVMHTWLAWQKSPGRPYGTAITAGYLDANAPLANQIVDWLNRLFYP